jgi:hypothetical protein
VGFSGPIRYNHIGPDQSINPANGEPGRRDDCSQSHRIQSIQLSFSRSIFRRMACSSLTPPLPQLRAVRSPLTTTPLTSHYFSLLFSPSNRSSSRIGSGLCHSCRAVTTPLAFLDAGARPPIDTQTLLISGAVVAAIGLSLFLGLKVSLWSLQ